MKASYLAKGKRGKIYLKGSSAIKQSAPLHVANEVKWIRILNKKGIAPKFLSSSENSFSYKFVKGEFLPQWIENQKSRTSVIKVLKDVLSQCRTMDRLKINKLEMHNPYKHIVVTKSAKPVLIDFERCYETKKPKNTTQFCQYITGKLCSALSKKGIFLSRKKFTPLLKSYKVTYSDNDFKNITRLIR